MSPTLAHAGEQTRDESAEGLGPSPRYEALREAEVVHVGQIRNERVRLDRFEVELMDGELYLAPDVEGIVSPVVFLVVVSAVEPISSIPLAKAESGIPVHSTRTPFRRLRASSHWGSLNVTRLYRQPTSRRSV